MGISSCWINGGTKVKTRVSANWTFCSLWPDVVRRNGSGGNSGGGDPWASGGGEGGWGGYSNDEPPF